MWRTIDSAPENRLVLTKIEGSSPSGRVRSVRPLLRQGGRWYPPKRQQPIPMEDNPTHWKNFHKEFTNG